MIDVNKMDFEELKELGSDCFDIGTIIFNLDPEYKEVQKHFYERIQTFFEKLDNVNNRK